MNKTLENEKLSEVVSKLMSVISLIAGKFRFFRFFKVTRENQRKRGRKPKKETQRKSKKDCLLRAPTINVSSLFL